MGKTLYNCAGAAVSTNAGSRSTRTYLAVQLIIGRKDGVWEGELSSFVAIGGLDCEGCHGGGGEERDGAGWNPERHVRTRYIA